MRGEHTTSLRRIRTSSGSSPLARGTRELRHHPHAVLGIIPACAGNTECAACAMAFAGDHPRLRGEHFLARSVPYLRAGSSPLARGTLVSATVRTTSRGSSPLARGTHGVQLVSVGCTGIIPACAGNTFGTAGIGDHRRDHPRLRGEHDSSSVSVRKSSGSSPLARGTQGWAGCLDAWEGIIPACAGNTPSPPRMTGSPGDHPRLRGEHTNTHENSQQ